jgi:hypothetical protein
MLNVNTIATNPLLREQTQEDSPSMSPNPPSSSTSTLGQTEVSTSNDMLPPIEDIEAIVQTFFSWVSSDDSAASSKKPT